MIERPWGGLAPSFDWRPSQAHLLDLATHVTDEQWHLCAPPGAGKTLIGLELARRLDRPTLVLSPTVAIRDQWRASTAMFGADPESFTSCDPQDPAPLLSITYQLLGNPGTATADMEAAARRLWLADLTAEFGAEAAAERIEAVERSDPHRAAADVSRHVRTLRRALASGDDVGLPVEDLLGPAANRLIDVLAANDIGCVVLDECHHLLDWWALVVAALVERLDPAVIGLTATLPDPDGAREAQNYARVVGDVDAELHLAALVAEGSVAPWRDAVVATPLAPDEQRFLDEWADHVADDLDELLARENFVGWAVANLLCDALDERTAAAVDARTVSAEGWHDFWDRDPLAAVATARWWRRRGLSLPAGFSPPDAADLDVALRLDDRLLLLDAWLHDPDSEATADDRDVVRRVTRRHGVSITTAGVRWGRSVADVVCARSVAKTHAAADIVAFEIDRRGSGCRALVVTERDRAARPPAEARAVLGEEAGTTATMLAGLCAEPTVLERGVIAVTGRGAWCDAVHAERVAAVVSSPGVDVGAVGTDITSVVALQVTGASWSSAQWLAAAETAMDAGVVSTLVSTRGLVGEGWDHPALNVLVDCSEVASRTATTQLRGRSLRIDPDDPAKVTSLWDVAVAHATAHGDWRRVRRRHDGWWGPDADGAIRTGAEKLHACFVEATPPEGADLAAVNAHSKARIADVDATRAAWAGVDPGGVATAAVTVRRRRPRRQVRTRAATWTRWIPGVGLGSVTMVAAATAAVALSPLAWPVAVASAAATTAMGTQLRGRRRREHETLVALGEATAAGLSAVGVEGLDTAHVEVVAAQEGRSSVIIAGVDDDAAELWSSSMAEVVGDLATPRWLIAVDGEAWRVPGPVGARREAAEAFAAAVARRIPGATLHGAGSPTATEHVLRAARRRPDEVTRSLRWR